MHRETGLFLSAFVLVATVRSSIGIDRHWLPDLEWQTGRNWIDGLLPDADSRVVFPGETWHTVGLPDTGNVEVAEIVLPREGSLSLGKNGILTFSGTKKSKKSARWSKKGLYMWIDPDNWNGYVNATPHTERIPCEYDTVVLPSKNRTLSLVLPNVDVHVRAVRIDHEKTTLNRWEWTRLADEPREIYKSRLTVTYASGSQQPLCDDCTCHGGMDEELSEEVCSYMWHAEKCGPPLCEYPLKVEGHCCDYCGGRIVLSNTASLSKVESQVDFALASYNSIVTWHARRTWDGKVEVLIAESGAYTGITSQEAVDVLSDLLTVDGYDVLENVATGSALRGSTLFTTLVPMLGIPVILVLLILAAIPYFGYSYSQVFSGWRGAFASSGEVARPESKSKTGGSFGFARFKNVPEGDVIIDEAEEVPAEGASDEEDSDANGPSSSGKRFENPLYRSKRDEKRSKSTGEPLVEEKMIDIDGPVSLAGLESRVREDGIEEVCLDSSRATHLSRRR